MTQIFIFILVLVLISQVTGKLPELNVFLINLSNRADKHEISNFQLDYLGLNYTRIDAINGTKVQNYFQRNETKNSTIEAATGIHGLNLKRENLFNNAGFKGLNLGCWLSHMKVFQIITESKTDHPSLILEDDFLADADAINLMEDLMNTLPKDWDVIQVGHCAGRWACSKFVNKNICLAKKIMIPCVHGYIIKNKKVAHEMFRLGNRPSPVLADDYFEGNNLNRYIIFPYIFSQLKKIKPDLGSGGGEWPPLANRSLEHMIFAKFINNKKVEKRN